MMHDHLHLVITISFINSTLLSFPSPPPFELAFLPLIFLIYPDRFRLFYPDIELFYRDQAKASANNSSSSVKIIHLSQENSKNYLTGVKNRDYEKSMQVYDLMKETERIGMGNGRQTWVAVANMRPQSLFFSTLLSVCHKFEYLELKL
jgi:hypothetical protein